jgi:3-hydroxyacyl-[acyl-carrier-protein] dehydratase
MNPMDSQTSSSPGQASTAAEPQALGGDRKGPIVDLRSIDLCAVAYDKAEVERFLPHRGTMSLIDHVVYRTPDWSHSVALQRVRGDEFWCAGHFPQKATMPGVIMVETAAQLSAFVFMAARNDPSGVLFLRIDHCAFRNSVHPGDDFYVLCQSIKMQRRRFITDVQGIVLRDGEQKITFGATLSGMTV